MRFQSQKLSPFLKALSIFVSSWMLFGCVLFILYITWLRDWQMNWGATKEEIHRKMAGDELLVDPEFNATRAVEIGATVEQVWPWIVQMGMGRGGLYNFDHLDNGGRSSAERVIPELQNLKVGDFILPLLQVKAMEPPTSMLWVFLEGAGGWAHATWSWGLYETDHSTTRLFSRLRQKYNHRSFIEMAMYGFQEVTEIFMMNTCLRRMKHNIEAYYKIQTIPADS